MREFHRSLIRSTRNHDWDDDLSVGFGFDKLRLVVDAKRLSIIPATAIHPCTGTRRTAGTLQIALVARKDYVLRLDLHSYRDLLTRSLLCLHLWQALDGLPRNTIGLGGNDARSTAHRQPRTTKTNVALHDVEMLSESGCWERLRWGM